MSGRNGLGFTPKQGQYLAFIDAYTRVNRRPPAEWEMQRHFGVTPPSVHQMILTLERAGFILGEMRLGGWLGVRMKQMTDELAETMNVNPPRGG